MQYEKIFNVSKHDEFPLYMNIKFMRNSLKVTVIVAGKQIYCGLYRILEVSLQLRNIAMQSTN